jgi:hypothetical protein
MDILRIGSSRMDFYFGDDLDGRLDVFSDYIHAVVGKRRGSGRRNNPDEIVHVSELDVVGLILDLDSGILHGHCWKPRFTVLPF